MKRFFRPTKLVKYKYLKLNCKEIVMFTFPLSFLTNV